MDFFEISVYKKEMSGHILQEINAFLRKLDFKVKFILIKNNTTKIL